jgi:hypothetical protein
MQPNFQRRDFQDKFAQIKLHLKKDTPLFPVHEFVAMDFLYPRDPTNPLSISSGVLTGGKRLWTFHVSESHTAGSLYYFVFDARVINRFTDGTTVIELLDVALAKAQLGVDGYLSNLERMYRTSKLKVFGGYTRFTPSMIHATGISLRCIDVARLMVEYMGCLHMKSPLTKYVSMLLDLICEHRIRPSIDLSKQCEPGELVVSSHLTNLRSVLVSQGDLLTMRQK